MGETRARDWLACPRCGGALAEGEIELRCAACRVGYPVIGGVPWLFAHPGAACAEWRARLDRALLEIERERASVRRVLVCSPPAPTRSRLTHLSDALDGHEQSIRDVLAPLALEGARASYEAHLALRTRLPVEQGLTTYYANLHRDWCWGHEENTATLELVTAARGGQRAERVLVLGSGGGRLAFDLHRAWAQRLTVALDLNPLLVLAAQRLVAGDVLHLWEFPIAPRLPNDCAVVRELRAPAPVPPGFHLVLGDAVRPPLRRGAFDVVLTPWLIDVLADDLAELASRINALLAPGGIWLHFGSLAFARQSAAARYGVDEVSAIVSNLGFSEPCWNEAEIPYMCSPASRHRRRELVTTFASRKRSEVSAPPAPAVPEWLVTGTDPVPLDDSFRLQAATTRVHAFIMGLIDGQRSLRDMAAIMEAQRLMPRAEAEASLRGFLLKMLDESRSSRAL